MSSTAPANRVHSLFLGAVWALCLAAWTVGLLTSKPAEVNRQLFSEEISFLLSKGLHVSAYAFLTAFALWMTHRPQRWLLLAGLSVHAAGTEFLQRYVPGRSGSLEDVLIDHAGILLGLALTWRYWRSR